MLFKPPNNQDPFLEVTKKLAQLNANPNLKFATIAGGSFWCMEGPFEQLKGVETVISGFAGGTAQNPTYEQVIIGVTGHREAVQIFYDPNKTNFKELLDIYWFQIDPTDPGGQFADRGNQYKTAIFYNNDEEKQIAEKSKQEIQNSGRYNAPIATQILPFTTFYPAEDYHQDFYLKSADKYKRYELLSGRQKYKEEIKKHAQNT